MAHTGSTSGLDRHLLDALFIDAHTTNTFSNDAVDPAVIAAVYQDIRSQHR